MTHLNAKTLTHNDILAHCDMRCIFESFGSDRLARPCVDVVWWRAQQTVDTQPLKRDATLGG